MLVGLMLLAAALPTADEAPSPPAATHQNPIWAELFERGVAFGDGQAVRLAAATLPDRLDARAQQQAISKITDENHPLSALERKAVVAPFVLRIKDEPPAGAQRPRRVDFWFVAYGDVDRLSDEEFLNEVANLEVKSQGSQSPDDVGVLSDDRLRLRNIAPEPDKRYVAVSFTLFDRVKGTLVMQSMLTRTSDSVVVAAALDPRFDRDAEFPNSWRSIHRDEAGRLTVDKPRPYAGVGWYCKATQLAQPAGAVFIEYHLVFDEPQGWFNGANLLRSKLPLLVQDGIRKFRRRFAGQAQPAGRKENEAESVND